MARFNIVDETIIEADPASVYQALIDLATGKAAWWLPHLKARPRGNIPADQVGGIVDVRVRPGRPRFAFQMREIVPYKRLRYEYIEGDFSGEGLWIIEPAEHGTRLQFHWQAQTQSWLMRVLARTTNIGKAHSKLMQHGFTGLTHYVHALQKTLKGTEENSVPPPASCSEISPLALYFNN